VRARLALLLAARATAARATAPRTIAARVLAAVVLAAGGTAPLTSPASAAPVGPSTGDHIRVSISLRPGTEISPRPVTITGRVVPAAPRRVVKMQLSTDDGWRTVAVGHTGRRSRYAFTFIPPGTGTYVLRVRKPPGGGTGRGTSAAVTLAVTPSLPPT